MLPFISYNFDEPLTQQQLDALILIGKMALAKAILVFVVGAITNNVSQVDKLWSLMPPIYAWAIVAFTGAQPRQVLVAALITVWGLRLTYNFSRKGGYSWKFWDGEEDYRWAVLRKKPGFSNPIVWFIFNLAFISFYQSFMIAGFATLPMIIAIQDNPVELNALDFVGAVFVLSFIVMETVAD